MATKSAVWSSAKSTPCLCSINFGRVSESSMLINRGWTRPNLLGGVGRSEAKSIRWISGRWTQGFLCWWQSTLLVRYTAPSHRWTQKPKYFAYSCRPLPPNYNKRTEIGETTLSSFVTVPNIRPTRNRSTTWRRSASRSVYRLPTPMPAAL